MRRSFLLLFFFIVTGTAYGQKISISEGPLSQALREIEEQTEWRFNFDSKLVEPINVGDASIDMSHPELALQELLSTTNIEFELQEHIVLLLPPIRRSYSLCGTLVSGLTGEGIPFAHVYVDNYTGVWTDDQGSFAIESQGYKNERLFVSCLGYDDMQFSFEEFREGCMDIVLEPDPNIFSEEVIIRDYMFSSLTRGEAYGNINLDVPSLRNDLGAVDTDILRTLQFLPGITSLDETASNLTIRGAAADQNLILWEDAPVYNSGHFFGMVSSINPFSLDNIKIHNGVCSASYENRLGGVIDMSMSDDIPTKLGIGIGATMTEVHADIKLPLVKDKLGAYISVRSSFSEYIDDNVAFTNYGEKVFQSTEFLDDMEEEDQSDTELSLGYGDLNAKLIFSPSERLKLSASLFYSNSSFDNEFSLSDGEVEGSDFWSTTSLIVANKISYDWSPRASSTLRVNFSKYASTYNFFFEESLDEENDIDRINSNDIKDLQVKWSHRISRPGAVFEMGYAFDKKHLSFGLAEFSRYEEDFELIEEQPGQFHHLFANAQKNYKGWIFDLGARLSYFDHLDAVGLTPRFTLSRSISDFMTCRLSAGIFNQSVGHLQTYNDGALNIVNKIWVLGDEDLMQASKVNFGITINKAGWLLDLDSYVHTSMSVPVISSGQSTTLQIDQNGSSVAYGLEALLKKRWRKLNFAMSYHLGFVDFTLPEVDDSFAANNDQRHNFSLISHYNWKGWHIGFQYSLRSGLPFTDIDGLTLVEEEEEDYYELNINGVNDSRFSAYQRLDLTLGYQKQFFDKINLSLQFSILNAFDDQNILSRNYILSDREMMTPEPEIFEVEKFQLRTTPQILVRLTY